MKQEAFHSVKSRRQRVNDPDGTKRNIIEVATEEFAGKGFSGARVDDIAASTKTSKRHQTDHDVEYRDHPEMDEIDTLVAHDDGLQGIGADGPNPIEDPAPHKALASSP